MCSSLCVNNEKEEMDDDDDADDDDDDDEGDVDGMDELRVDSVDIRWYE